MKKGIERAPHRSLMMATGIRKEDINKPYIGVCNSYTNIVPGHCHLKKVGEIICDEIRKAGGVPYEFNTIAICDGIAMGHDGMKYSLPSRELIADCVESMGRAHPFDGMVFTASLLPTGRFANEVKLTGDMPLGFAQFEAGGDGKLGALVFAIEDQTVRLEKE